MPSYVKSLSVLCFFCTEPLIHYICMAVHVIAKGTAGTAGLQLGRVFVAHNQTAVQSINTSQDRSHHRASVMTSAPLGALKTLPTPLQATSIREEKVRSLRTA